MNPHSCSSMSVSLQTWSEVGFSFPTNLALDYIIWFVCSECCRLRLNRFVVSHVVVLDDIKHLWSQVIFTQLAVTS